MNHSELLSHLLALEVAAMRAVGTDVPLLDSLLDEDFHEIGQSGRRWRREEILALAAGATPDVSDGHLIRLGEDCAQLSYRCVAGPKTVLRSSIWRRQGDRWRMVFHQGTPAA